MTSDMTDQELLRLAALAAEYELEWVPEWPGGGCFMLRVVPEPEPPFPTWVPWNPLNDDGDALRLAVTLGMQLDLRDPATRVYGAVDSGVIEVFHRRELGALGATRRAIVRCAAEIGRRIEQEES